MSDMTEKPYDGPTEAATKLIAQSHSDNVARAKRDRAASAMLAALAAVLDAWAVKPEAAGEASGFRRAVRGHHAAEAAQRAIALAREAGIEPTP